MHRFYCPDLNSLELSAEESHHALHVLRMEDGAEAVAFDGKGHEAKIRIRSKSPKVAGFEIIAPFTSGKVPSTLTLAQAVPKGKAMDLIIQKATELGVSQIQPLTSDRTVVQIDSSKTESKQSKWQNVAIEACKQCGQNWLPTVHSPMKQTEFIDSNPSASLKLIASLQEDAQPLGQVLAEARDQNQLDNVLFLVGPEGDFTPAEIGKARGAGYTPVSLGPNILRSETAAIFICSVVLYEMLNASRARS